MIPASNQSRRAVLVLPIGPRTRALHVLCIALATATIVAQSSVPLPNRPDSVSFAAIGDNGTGERPQYEIAQQMNNAHATFAFDLVINAG